MSPEERARSSVNCVCGHRSGKENPASHASTRRTDAPSTRPIRSLPCTEALMAIDKVSLRIQSTALSASQLQALFERDGERLTERGSPVSSRQPDGPCHSSVELSSLAVATAGGAAACLTPAPSSSRSTVGASPRSRSSPKRLVHRRDRRPVRTGSSRRPRRRSCSTETGWWPPSDAAGRLRLRVGSAGWTDFVFPIRPDLVQKAGFNLRFVAPSL